jgi:hypothetical protein
LKKLNKFKLLYNDTRIDTEIERLIIDISSITIDENKNMA